MNGLQKWRWMPRPVPSADENMNTDSYSRCESSKRAHRSNYMCRSREYSMKIKPNLILIWLSCFVSLLSMGICSAQTIGGTVLAWGDGSWGETNVPAAATNVIGLAAGDENCIALRSDGTIVTWGSYGYYDRDMGPPTCLLDITNSVESRLAMITVLRSARAERYACGAIFLFDTTPEVYNLPPDATNGVALALGPGQQHVLVLASPWHGCGLGFFLTSYNATIPPNARNIVSVVAGAFHSEALRSDGDLLAGATIVMGKSRSQQALRTLLPSRPDGMAMLHCAPMGP